MRMYLHVGRCGVRRGGGSYYPHFTLFVNGKQGRQEILIFWVNMNAEVEQTHCGACVWRVYVRILFACYVDQVY